MISLYPFFRENLWIAKTQLPRDQEVEYCYSFSVIVEPEVSKLPKRAFIIRKWESFPPRKIRPQGNRLNNYKLKNYDVVYIKNTI